MQYQKIVDERLNLLQKAELHPELQLIEIDFCTRDILYFFRNYLYTEKNKTIFSWDEPNVIPFIPFEYQEECITEIWESIIEGNKPLKDRKKWVLTNVLIEKSRQMWISWLISAIFLYGFLFHKHKYTVISRTEEEVDRAWDMDSIFEKIRFMIRNIPKWMLPQWFEKELWKNKSNVFMKITDPNGEASITWKTANPDAWRWGTRNAIFMDEMAFMKNASQINKSAWSNSPCLIYNSTPNWEGNEFFTMRKLCFERTDKETGKKLPPEIKGLRYHWREHPHYDEEWYKWKTTWKTKEQIAQEYEIDYNTAIVWRVYDNFPKQAIDIKYNHEKPLYIAMDNSHWWQDPNAIIVMQPNNHFIDIIDCIEILQPPEYCAEYLRWQPRFIMSYAEEQFLKRFQTYNTHKAIYISDPYDTKSAMWSSSILDDYRKNGINLFLPQERNKQEQILKTRTNIYRVRYNDNCIDFASAIMNARYPDKSNNSTTDNTKPVHNWTSHYRTALEYLICYLLENPLAEKRKVVKDTRVRRDYVTGKLINL